MSMLRMARVAAVHPEDNSVDVVLVDDGSRWPGVQMLTPHATTRTGTSDLPEVTELGDKWSLTEQRSQDMIAIVGFLSPSVPVVLGFLFPQVNQVLFADKNRRVSRHASDVYSTIDGDGNAEFYHPSGTYLRVGTDPAHEDLTGQDYDARWAIDRNTDKAVHLRVRVSNAGAEKASISIDPSGNITITHTGDLTVNTSGKATVNVSGTTDLTSGGAVTVTAPSVKLDTPQTTCTGKLTVQGLLTYQAGLSGSGGSGAALNGPFNLTGAFTSTGTLQNNGKNVGSTHTHSGVQTGGGTTGQPT